MLGWSLGGLIAHEMAVQLRSAGDTISLLAMMDSYVLSRELAETVESDLAELLREFGVQVELPDGELSIEQAIDNLHDQSGLLATLDAPQLERLYAGYPHGTELASTRPRTARGDIVFFTASADSYNRTDPTRNAAAWRPFVEGEIHNYRVGYRHSAMTTPKPSPRSGRFCAAISRPGTVRTVRTPIYRWTQPEWNSMPRCPTSEAHQKQDRLAQNIGNRREEQDDDRAIRRYRKRNTRQENEIKTPVDAS